MDTISLLSGEDFEDKLNEEIRSSKIFVFDFLSHKLIQNHHIKHFFADEQLTKRDREDIFDHVVSRLYWYNDKKISGDLTTEEKKIFSFLDPLYIHQKLLVTLLQFSMIKNILEIEKPKKIFATQNLARIVNAIRNDIQIILLNSEQVEIFDSFDLRMKIFSKKISLKISMNTVKKIQSIYESVMGMLFNFWLDEKERKPIILLLEFEPIKYPELFKKLNSSKFNCVVLNRRKSPILDYNSMKILRRSNTQIINFKRSLSKKEKCEIKFLVNKYREFLKEFCNNDDKLKEIFSFKDLSYFSCVKDFFIKQFESEIESNVENLIQSNHIFKNFDIRCILYQYESGTSENITLSQRKKIPSLLIRHGFASFSDKIDDLRWRYDQFRLLDLDCNKVIVWGNADYDYYSKFLSKEIELKKIGSPRHDEFFRDINRQNDNEKTVLITTPPVIEWTGLQSINLELKYEKILQQIVYKLKEIPHVRIIVKLHPGWGWKFNHTLIKILNEIDPKLSIFSTKSIIELISNCDIMININAEENQPSTVMLEGLIKKKPVINISLDESIQNLEYDGMSSIISLSYKADIVKYVRDLFDNDVFYSEISSRMERDLQHYLINHKNASERLADLLKSFI